MLLQSQMIANNIPPCFPESAANNFAGGGSAFPEADFGIGFLRGGRLGLEVRREGVGRIGKGCSR